jgi:hypothetical protein
VGLAAALSLVFSQHGSASSSAASPDLSGDFIIRCFYNGNIATQDPIEAPTFANPKGSFNTGHLHAFFGNLAAGAAALNGSTQVPFPGMTAGENGGAGTMENNGLSPETNCQDGKDTAGYWTPEPYMQSTPTATPTPYLPGGGCTTTGCAPSTHLYMRAYYIPHGSAANVEIPDGTFMIAGFPNGCVGVTGHGCGTGNSFPNDLSIVQYSCGADSGDGLSTPHSAWPYDCTKYVDADDNFSDGLVAFINFPYCWDGQKSFPAPNSPVNTQTGLPTTMVPGYVPPWVDYTAWQAYSGLHARPANDFSYPGAGGCPAGDQTTVQLEQRLHLVKYFGQGLGDPSTCTGDAGIDWNTAANVENSASGGATPSDSKETYESKTNDDGDAKFQVGTTPGGVKIWGFHKCPAPPSAPDPSPTAAALSFACSPQSLGGDLNCSTDIGIPNTTTGCGAVGGHCFVGTFPDGWETLHADYWQTWHEAKNMLDSQGGDDVTSDSGTFGDLLEDCVNGTGAGSCSFVTNDTPAAVYGSPSPPNP